MSVTFRVMLPLMMTSSPILRDRTSIALSVAVRWGRPQRRDEFATRVPTGVSWRIVPDGRYRRFPDYPDGRKTAAIPSVRLDSKCGSDAHPSDTARALWRNGTPPALLGSRTVTPL